MRPLSEQAAQELGESRQEARREAETCRRACCAELPVRRPATLVEALDAERRAA